MPADSTRPWLDWPVGSRVMVRRRIDDATHRFTDVLGEVLACGPEGVVLRTRTGDVSVPGAEIAIGKPIPPPPARRRPRT